MWPTYFGKGLRGWFRAFLLTGVDGPRFEFFSIDPGTLSFWMTIGVLAIVGYRFWALPFIWILLFVMIYRTMKVPFYHWYAAPALVGLSIVTGAGLAALLSLARRAVALKQAEGPLLVALGAVLVVLAGYPHLRALPETSKPHVLLGVYTAAGQWLHDHTPPGSTVGYYEIGFVGYYSDRPIVDSLGLVDPSIPPHVAKGDLAWAFRERRPAFILRKADAIPLNSFAEEPWFAAEYRERLVFAPPGDPNQSPRDSVRTAGFFGARRRPVKARHLLSDERFSSLPDCFLLETSVASAKDRPRGHRVECILLSGGENARGSSAVRRESGLQRERDGAAATFQLRRSTCTSGAASGSRDRTAARLRVRRVRRPRRGGGSDSPVQRTGPQGPSAGDQ